MAQTLPNYFMHHTTVLTNRIPFT